MPTRRLLLTIAILAALALPASAQAAPKLLLDATTVLDGSLAARPGADAGACHRAYRPGAAGVATKDVTLSGPGSLEVRLDGAEGDWDVAVFDAAGNVLAADASPDAREVAERLRRSTGGTLRVQACRRAGDAASVPATLEHSRDRARRPQRPRRPTRRSSSTSSRPTRAQQGAACWRSAST